MALNRKKVIFCDNSLKAQIRFRLPVMQAYRKAGWEVVAIASTDCPWPEGELYRNFKFYPVSLQRGGMNPFSDLRYWWSLLKIYRRERPDYIFHYTVKPNIYGAFAATLLKIPFAMFVVGLGYIFSSQSIGARIGRAMYNKAFSRADKVIVINKNNFDVISSQGVVDPSRLVLLPGGEGLDIEFFK